MRNGAAGRLILVKGQALRDRLPKRDYSGNDQMNTTMPLRKRSAVWSRTLAKPAIIVTLVGTVTAALLVPHVVNGHLLSLSVPATQSLLIAVDLLIAGALMTVLNREIVKERIEKETLQRRLTSSFRYIGQANVCLELIKEHSVALSAAGSAKEVHQVLSHLHTAIAAGIAGATAARLRVISVDTGRTITEYVWAQQKGYEPPSISNKLALHGAAPPSVGRGPLIVRSAFREGGILCAFAGDLPWDGGVDTELLHVLLNHFHLLFLFSHNHKKESE